MKLVLGSAQFGLDYGVTNKRGQVNEAEVVHILEYAAESGVSLIDTAVAYGDSEMVLGRCCSKTKQYDFISKIQLDCNNDAAEIARTIDQSCQRLAVNKLYGILVHDVDVLLGSRSEFYWDELKKLKKQRKINKLGVSVYSPEQANQILDKFEIDIIQVPCNLLDQRFLQSGVLKKLKKKNIEVHVRSIFLQGFLLSDFAKIHKYFKPILPKLQRIDQICSSNNISKLELTFEFLKKIKDVDAVVFGVTTIKELEQVIAAFNRGQLKGIEVDYKQLIIAEEKFINPSRWVEAL